MTKAQLQLDQELVQSCVQLSPPGSMLNKSLPIWSAPPTNTIPGAIPKWLMLFERITRSTGPVAHILPSSKSQDLNRSLNVSTQRWGAPYELTRLGTTLIATLGDAWPFVRAPIESPNTNAELDQPEMRFCPALSLLFESAKERDLAQLVQEPINTRKEWIWLCDILNGFCDQIRLQASSARFRDRQKEFLRVPNDNYRWLKRLVDECFIGNSSLSFSYFDLGYSEVTNAKSFNFYAQAKADRKSLQDCIVKLGKLSSTILGYGINLRYLPYNGYHYRLFFISQPSENHSITTTIEKEWGNITGQTGVVFDHLRNGQNKELTNIARENNSSRKNLVKKMYFLTQLDSLIQPKLPPKDFRFFRGPL